RAARHRDLRPPPLHATPMRRRMLDRHRQRPAPFPADPEPLEQPHRHEEDRRPEPDTLVRGEQADRRRRQPHDQERQIQHRLAAELVAVMAEHDAADGPRREPYRIGRERRHGAGQRRERGKEELVEDERGGGAVEKEVVPLDRRADEAGGGDLDDFRTAFQVAGGDRGGHDASITSGRGGTRVPKIMAPEWRDGNRTPTPCGFDGLSHTDYAEGPWSVFTQGKTRWSL